MYTLVENLMGFSTFINTKIHRRSCVISEGPLNYEVVVTLTPNTSLLTGAFTTQ